MSKIRSWVIDLLTSIDPRMVCSDACHNDRNLGLHFGGRWGRIDHMILYRIDRTAAGELFIDRDSGIDVKPPSVKLVTAILESGNYFEAAQLIVKHNARG